MEKQKYQTRRASPGVEHAPTDRPKLWPGVVIAGLDPAIHLTKMRGSGPHDKGRDAAMATSMMTKVTRIKCLGGYRLQATFSDGTAGEYDFSARVSETGPMVEPLRDPAYFARVFLEYGAPTWPNGYDMCPDWLRREIEMAGRLESGQ
jgi:hypothetical protein